MAFILIQIDEKEFVNLECVVNVFIKGGDKSLENRPRIEFVDIHHNRLVKTGIFIKNPDGIKIFKRFSSFEECYDWLEKIIIKAQNQY